MTQPNDIQFSAILNNDEAHDGLFIYGVTTTKIFCLPSCASRAPLRKHIVIFDDIGQAQRDGFRACLRCQTKANWSKINRD